MGGECGPESITVASSGAAGTASDVIGRRKRPFRLLLQGSRSLEGQGIIPRSISKVRDLHCSKPLR